ncbi:MAG: FAD-binding protein [Bacteroidales bacterium]|nr:FAD-binding protein [Bacteroidales bacterium]
MRFGLIGYPIAHSLSPQLFRAAYPDVPYRDTYELIETANFDEAVSIFKRDFDAINVTAPFKEKAFAIADRADRNTERIGASNLLIKKDGLITAYNTDYEAVVHMLTALFSQRPFNNVLVAGCGGAGKAAALAACDSGRNVTVANRDFAKAQHYCNALGGMKAAHLEDMPTLIAENELLIYTIPTLINELRNNLSEKVHNLSGKTVIEANYRNPSLSGGNYISGKHWLAVQAVISYKLMTGIAPMDTPLINLLL